MKKTILILHGWGLGGRKYSLIEHIFETKGFRVLAPDLPGFGDNPLTKDAMTVSDYALFVKKYLDAKKIKKVYIIGHSFGGRVAAKFAALYPAYVEKLILTGSPLIKTKLSGRKRVISFLVKKSKKLTGKLPSNIYQPVRWLTYRLLGEWDYYKSNNLRETFIHVMNEDLTSFLPNITAQTLILWGENDTFVPVAIGKKIAQIIPNATFIGLPGFGHGLPYTNAKEFSKISLKFFQS